MPTRTHSFRIQNETIAVTRPFRCFRSVNKSCAKIDRCVDIICLRALPRAARIAQLYLCTCVARVDQTYVRTYVDARRRQTSHAHACATTIVSRASTHGRFFITRNICTRTRTRGRLPGIENAYFHTVVIPAKYLGAYPGYYGTCAFFSDFLSIAITCYTLWLNSGVVTLLRIPPHCLQFSCWVRQLHGSRREVIHLPETRLVQQIMQ